MTDRPHLPRGIVNLPVGRAKEITQCVAVVEPREFVRSVVDLVTGSQRRTVRSVLAEASSSRPPTRTHPQHLAGERPIEVYILILPADRHILLNDVSAE